ncbi:hypothetical protein HD806DRAFT_529492 [Xylariaceae sp. AK1471]|nr:hypothetical protein HD806DRAFT_529492 [Xylariaceae sp. AK1471]
MQDEPTSLTPRPSPQTLSQLTPLSSPDPQPIEGEKDQPGPRTPPSTREATLASFPCDHHHEVRDTPDFTEEGTEHTDEPDDNDTFEGAMNEIIAEGPIRLGTPIAEPEDEAKQPEQPSSRPKRPTASKANYNEVRAKREA